VPVDVLDKEQVQALTERFGVVSDPAVLVFRAPGRLYVRLDGFVDRETVAQAAQNALTGAGS
jgi:thiol:disulfide interchange protein